MPIGRPVAKKLDIEARPAELFYRLYERYDFCFLLESIGKGRLSNFSYVGFSPVAILTCKGSNEFLVKDNRITTYNIPEPLSVLRGLTPMSALPGDGFFGGLVGYISYDSINYWERLDMSRKEDASFPEMEFGLFLDWIVFDNRQNSVYYVTYQEDRRKEVEETLSKGPELGKFSVQVKESSLSDKEFFAGIAKAKEYIRKGEIFQVVLSRRYTYDFDGDLRTVYHVLRRSNPSPYMFFLKFKERQLVGSSPEMLVRVQRGLVETFPIAGTRQRSQNRSEDSQLRNELLHDEKERAEHVMLVDLARNDIGKVSRWGTVKVKRFMQVRRYSHVQHLVSHISGELESSYDSFDALKATFPAGTVTGAPKPRAMEIIDEIEPIKRGPYGGAVGYFSLNGNADFAITIRTLFTEQTKVHIQAGAGIVADSRPERETVEVESKLRVLYEAINNASRELP